MNQMNMSTRGSFFASPIAWVVYAACWARETPFGSPSCFVSWPYSVIQIRTLLRLNHLSSDCSKRGERRTASRSATSPSASASGSSGVGYGCCAHASNLSRGLAAATSWAKRPASACPSCRSSFLSRPCDEVEPIATFARELPALMPGVRRRVHLRVEPRPDRPALGVELRREEELQVRLVPDRVAPDPRVLGIAAGVAGRDGPREILQVVDVPGDVVRRLAAVRPLGRAPDRDDHLETALLCVADELVDVREPIRRVERDWPRSSAASAPSSTSRRACARSLRSRSAPGRAPRLDSGSNGRRRHRGSRRTSAAPSLRPPVKAVLQGPRRGRAASLVSRASPLQVI